MIATLTLNPAIDKNLQVQQLIPEKKMRCSAITTEAGGGGINISKAIHELGGESIAVFPVGGMSGQQLLELVKQKGIITREISIAGSTRENFNADEVSTDKQFRFVTPGPALSVSELNAILKTVESLENISFLVCSGSLPPGVPVNFIASLALLCRQKNIKFIVDTSGEALQKALEQGVYLLKPNVTELRSLAGKDYLEEHEIAEAAAAVMATGKVEVIVVSMGPAGAMLVTKEGNRKFRAPVVKKLSTVGAGDSMVAGMVWMLQQHKSLEEAVRFGIACGTAATIRKGTQLFSKHDVERLYATMLKD